MATSKYYTPQEQSDMQNFDLKSSIYWKATEGLKDKDERILFKEEKLCLQLKTEGSGAWGKKQRV